ncbi:hypothetical protein EJ03DRAFT_339586 [Teratosphaeria nubilosa]|uniref:ASST-domain-containing protein n=1 Tax=Teratosphaeria nubilosa TaxID=161662 RepID=A0A6G1KWJ1_9PEZI|nr:hypothetical protein EJ03DRAFT_339586 [Teratosphaeria nubilosa]
MATLLLLNTLLLSTTTLATTIIPASQAGNASWPYYTYKTSPYQPPVLSITPNPPTSPSPTYLFLAPDGPYPHQVAPLIYTPTGDPIWNGEPHQHAFAFGVQTYRGEKVLVSWNGTNYREPIGRGYGYVYLRDKHYDIIHNITLPGPFLSQLPNTTYGSNIDLHEIFITEHGTLLITANNVTQTDLTSVGGPPNGWIVEAQFYELDIATNTILFAWKSLDHLDKIPLTASVYPLGSDGQDGTTQSKAWGYIHINAVSPLEENGYIFSSRFLCAGVAISRGDGSVKWILQGRNGGDFKLGAGAQFCYQHDIRAVAGGEAGTAEVVLSLHDNANSPIENGTTPTSGKLLRVNFATKEVRLQQEFLNASGPTFSTAQGNMQIMTNGHVFLGHGWIPVLEEYTAEGEILATWRFGDALERAGGGFWSPLKPTLSYRAFRQAWVGCPRGRPDVVAEGDGGTTRVYVSWNGATEVAGWEVWGGGSEGGLRCVKTVGKAGFETEVEVVEAGVEFVRVQAVWRDGVGACEGVGEGVSEVVRVER